MFGISFALSLELHLGNLSLECVDGVSLFSSRGDLPFGVRGRVHMVRDVVKHHVYDYRFDGAMWFIATSLDTLRR
jgi:hypothetical protein